MDLQLILRVIWRFRVVVGIGFLLAFGLAFLSYYKVTPGGDRMLTPRQSESWESLSTIFVTSRGFPWGSTGVGSAAGTAETDAESDADGSAAARRAGPDPVHLTGLASLYIRLATSDAVIEEVEKSGPIVGGLQAFPVSSDDTGRGAQLPMVTLAAQSIGPKEAEQLAARHVKAFVSYIEREQQRAGIPPEERVVLQVVRQPQKAELLQGRKKTRPIIVLVAVMIVVLGLAFTLENLRPRGPRALPADAIDFIDAARRPADVTRRSA
jgi:hypothetical protein